MNWENHPILKRVLYCVDHTVKLKVEDIVKPSKVSHFRYYRDGDFIYMTDKGFLFPIPLKDIEGDKATLHTEERTIMLMRWIRIHVENINSSNL